MITDKTIQIRMMEEADRAQVREMMRVFYSSDAVETNGSDEIFTRDIDECVGGSPYAEGYVFVREGIVIGYAMLAKSFSTEYGRQCIWTEDIYIIPQYRRCGIGRAFFEYISEKYKGAVIRLEAEKNNDAAVKTYTDSGFTVVPYLELWKTGGGNNG